MRSGKLQATRFFADYRDQVTVGKTGASCGADHIPFHVSTDIGKLNRSIRPSLLFECPLLDGIVDISQIINTDIHLARRATLDETGQRN